MRILGLLSFVLFAVAGPVLAGEYAVLVTGSRLHVERHEVVDGAKIRLYQGGGFVEMDVAAVSEFEKDEMVAQPSAPAPEPVPLAVAVPVAAPSLFSASDLADAAADKYGLPRQLVRSVMAAESGFQPQVISPKGAIGLMQLMPGTAAQLGVDPFDPAQNVDAGTRYLRELLEKYNGGLRHALAAYNAGPGAVDKYDGVPPYRETVNYVFRIERDFLGRDRKSVDSTR
ncbi:MAG TPA: lytic transglycosylase domain-containing protein [Candidatus Solibacter sp.]|nr:lytic transglycosylase domain-containing protein [Candidatus Solibacter sp.]